MIFDAPLVGITGATGSIGVVLTKYLVEQGYRVRALVRSSEKARLLPEDIEIVYGDIENHEAMRDLLEDAGYVFHLAAVTSENEKSPLAKERYWQTNVLGTETLLNVAEEMKIRRFIFFSTIDVYGKDNQSEVDESSPARPGSLYAQSKLEAEKAVFRRCNKGYPVEFVILRFSSVYGPHMKGNFPKLVRALERGYFMPLGDGKNRRTMIYEIDACRAALLAAQHPSAHGKLYNVSDGSYYSVKELVTMICKVLGRKPPKFWLPEEFYSLVSRIADSTASLLGMDTDLSDAVKKFNADVAVKAEKMQKELGFKPNFSMEDGWRITIEEWKRNGII